MQVAVLGAGYVGLVTGAGLAGLGHTVRISEPDRGRLDGLISGVMPFFEPDLDTLVAAGVRDGLLSFHDANLDAVRDAEVILIAVPTPQGVSGAADTAIVDQVVEEIMPALDDGAVVALKSTTPADSLSHLQLQFDQAGRGVHLAVNPEFLREGSAVDDFNNPDRIVIGASSEHPVSRIAAMYEKLNAPLVVTDPVSASLIKYASNAYLATRVSFANAVANVCEVVGADVRDVLLGMGYDPRIGFHFLSPGPGFGGSCLPKDTSALVALAANSGYDFSLLRGVIEVNEQQMVRIVGKIRDSLPVDRPGRVALWGLAFKAGTDDIRESPAIRIATDLVDSGATVAAYDPRAEVALKGVVSARDPVDAARGADVVVVATEWREFQFVSLASVREVMAGDMIVDARNLLDPDAVRRQGLRYVGVGR